MFPSLHKDLVCIVCIYSLLAYKHSFHQLWSCLQAPLLAKVTSSHIREKTQTIRQPYEQSHDNRGFCCMFHALTGRTMQLRAPGIKDKNRLKLMTCKSTNVRSHRCFLSLCCSYGYPDPEYLSRVRGELKVKGIEWVLLRCVSTWLQRGFSKLHLSTFVCLVFLLYPFHN